MLTLAIYIIPEVFEYWAFLKLHPRKREERSTEGKNVPV